VSEAPLGLIRSSKRELSPETVDRRLRELAQFYELGVALREARFVGQRIFEPADMTHHVWRDDDSRSSDVEVRA
jgi:hypothetical protein